jgi:hypothetical protein
MAFTEAEYKGLLKNYPKVGATMPKQVWNGIKKADHDTNEHLGELWENNVKENVKRFLPKHGWINDGYAGIGRYKAIIAVGSGPSLSKNKDYLKTVSLADGTRDYEKQDFIVMSSNHQLKGCFDAGIIPHFAMVADGSPNLAKQLDVGSAGRHTILLANIITHPDVVAKWKGPVKFVCPKSDKIMGIVSDVMGEEIDSNRCVTAGGNILNLSFTVGLGLFRASVWMCVGNDLSYPPATDLKDRRKGFYEDGDYSTNIKSKRDEAIHEFEWAGFTLPKSTIWTPKNNINWKGEWLWTAPTLFYYKSWLETNSMILWESGSQFHVYNCTEGGILGVLLKEEMNVAEKYDEKFNYDNWFLMDEISKGRWRTRTLWHACEEFHETKQKLLGRNAWPGVIQSAVPYATNMGRQHTH